MDGIVFKVRKNSKVINKTVYIAVGLRTDGYKEVGRICIKRCINRLDSDNQLILQSDNKEFDTTIINAEDILEVWSAKLRIMPKFNNPSLNRITENAEDAQGAWSAKLRHADKFKDLSEILALLI